MNFKTTILLIIALAVLGVWLVVDRLTGSPKDAGKPAEVSTTDDGRKLFTVEPDDVTKLSIAPAEGPKVVL
ncbi:MAG: hypothetical protein ACREIT_07010, partial [Tepidisphaeraceae bacterium]